MKATKNILTAFIKTVLLLFLIVFQSCNTYRDMNSGLEQDLYNGNFNIASANLDVNKFLRKDRNHLLYLMEKGKVEHLLGNYEASNNYLEQAYIMIDDRIKSNVGQVISAQFTNPMAEPYKGEDFEKVTIHYYKALNYFLLGQPNEALVEAKRINIKLLELNDRYPSNKNKYSEDAFSQILQGIIYESTGDINNAFIAYRNAEEIYTKNGGNYFGVPMPEQLKADLLRTTKVLGFTEEHNTYRKQFNIAPDPVPAQPKKTTKKGKKGAKATPAPAPEPEKPKEPEVTGEAIVFWENGLGPAKDQIVITASGGGGIFYGSYMDGDQLEEIIIPIPMGSNLGSINAIAIPKYTERPSYYSKAAIVMDNNEQVLELAQSYYPIAKQCLKDRMLREVVDLAIRFAAKKAASAGLGALGKELLGDTGGDLVKLGADAAGAATEKADTRNWQSLPATISYTRLPLKEGDNKFVIKKYGPQGIDTDTLSIPYKKGLQIVNYFDLGRTQIINNSAALKTLLASNDNNSMNMAAGLTNAKSTPETLYQPAEGVTAQDIVNKYITVSGGSEKLQSIHTMYIKTAEKVNSGGTIVNNETISKQNDRNDYRIETYTNSQLTTTTVINDNEAYAINNGTKTKMPNQVVKNAKAAKNFYQLYTAPLNADDLKVQGITKINNEDAYVVTYTDKQYNTEITKYYSVQSGFLIASKSVMGKINVIILFSDFRDVNGMKFPFSSVTDSNGTKIEKITSKILINEGVSDSDFQ